MAADANSVALRFVEESTYGETPSGPPTLQTLRFTSESLKESTDSTKSNEIRADRATSDIIRTGVRAAGDINGEMSYGTYDTLIKHAFLDSAYSTVIDDTDTTYSMDDTDNSINDSGNGFVTDGWAEGMWMEIRGFTGTAANNGYARCETVAAGKIILSHHTVVTDAAGESVTLKNSGHLTAGTTLGSSVFEKEFTDLSNTFATYNGLSPNVWELAISSNGILTTRFGMIGKREVSVTSTIGDGSPTAATTTSVMNGIDNVVGIFEGGTSFDLTSFNFTLTNNLRERLKIGTLGAFELGKGSIDISGSFTAYLSSNTLPDKHLNWTDTSIAVVMEDAAGNAYALDIPSVKIVDSDRNATGLNTDVLLNATFNGKLHPTELITLGWSRFAA